MSNYKYINQNIGNHIINKRKKIRKIKGEYVCEQAEIDNNGRRGSQNRWAAGIDDDGVGESRVNGRAGC